MSELTHFNMQPLHHDPTTNIISPTTKSTPRALAAELQALNTLHHALTTTPEAVSPAGIPLPPVPVNPKRSAQISKLRDNGNAAYRRASYAEAIKLYTLGIQMALTRPAWEPSALVREELAGLYANRAQAHMALSQWAEGGVDAETSVEVRRVGNAKAWWRRGRCLVEMGRLGEAREWVKRALEVEGDESDLKALLVEIGRGD